MQNENELMHIIKEIYPQNPSKGFIESTENILRQKARSMNKKRGIKRLSVVSSSVLLFTLALSWLFLFSGQEVIKNVLTNLGEESVSSVTVDEKDPLVLIYHSHNRESYIPELNVTDNSKAFSETKNVTLVGKELSKTLNENDINSIHDDTDIHGILKEQNLSYANSYTVSRVKIQEILNQHKSIEMVLDIHRDSLKRADTTISIDGLNYARILFEVSKTSDNYEANRAMAIRLHEKLEDLYPGLSRGVVEKGVNPRNTYNQDLHTNSLLLDIGGVENTFEESYRTTAVLAEAIKEIMQE